MCEPSSRFTVDVDVASYPLEVRALFSAFRGTWWVAEADGGTIIGIAFEARLRPAGRPLRKRIERRLEIDLDEILSSYADSIAEDVTPVRSDHVELPGQTGHRFRRDPRTST